MSTVLSNNVASAADLTNGTTGTGDIVLATSPVLTGTPTAPTPSDSDNSTKIATTAFVQAIALTAGAVTSVFGRAGVVTATSGDYSFSLISGKAGLAQGGTNADLSATGGTSQVLKQVSTGANVTVGQLAASDLSNGTTGSGAVVLAGSPALTGNPTAPTQATSDNSTKIATTAYVQAQLGTSVTSVFGRTGGVVATSGDYSFSLISGTVGLSQGGTNTDLSSTGGTSYVLRQSSVGANITVSQLSSADLSDGVTGSGAIVLATSPTLITPSLGAATATSITGLTGAFTPNAAGGTSIGSAIKPFLSIYIGETSESIEITGVGTAPRIVTLPDANSNTIQPLGSATTNEWIQYIDSGGVQHLSQPAASNLSNGTTGTGAVVLAGSPTFTGAPLSTTPATVDNSTKIATTAYVQNQGYVTSASFPVTSVFGRTGAVVATSGDYSFSLISGTVAAAQLPDPTVSALGGVQAIAAVTHEWINSINTSGVPQLSQPAFTDISGTASTGQIPNLAASIITSGTLALAVGGTNANLSATGGTSFVLRQSSAGAAITVSQLAATDISNGTTGTGALVLAGSPTLTGAPLSTTPSTADNSTKIATTAYVQNQAYATLASPALSGTPTAPTAASSTNSTQVATTAFVQTHVTPTSISLGSSVPTGGGNFTVAHGLGVTPKAVTINMTSGGSIYFQSTRYDGTNIYLTATDTGVTGYAVAWV